MNDSLSTRGVVATVPNHIVTSEGLPITSFRLAASQRKFNRKTLSWENGDTNWYTVTAFRQLAINLAACVAKGDRVVVSGRLSIREWESGERSGTVVEIDADGVGHDLTWGTASFSRSIKRSEAPGPAEATVSTEIAGAGGWPERGSGASVDGFLPPFGSDVPSSAVHSSDVHSSVASGDEVAEEADDDDDDDDRGEMSAVESTEATLDLAADRPELDHVSSGSAA